MNRKMSIGLIIAGLLSTGCGDGDSDWSAKALEPSEATVSGVAFSWTPPVGLSKEQDRCNENTLALHSKEDHWGSPSFTVSLATIPPGSIENALLFAGVENMVVTRKEKLDDGFIVTAHKKGKGLLTVYTWIAAKGGALKCNAMQAKDGGVPNFDATVAMFEKACLSVTPKDKPPPKVEKPKVAVTPEMQDLMSQFGTHKTVSAALRKHQSKGLDTKDMGIYDLKEPRITNAWQKDAVTCYALSAKAGMTTRRYNLCWSDGKIQAIVDKGMAPPSL